MNNPSIAHSERLVVVVGPSGAGKDSVLRAWAALLATQPVPVHIAQRSITRPADGGHEDHEALTPESYDALQQADAFAIAWQAHDLGYGVRHTELAPLAQGHWVVLNGSRAHLPVLRAQAPRLAVVEVTAPASQLAARLAHRGREDAQAVSTRLQRAAPPVHADLTLVNDSSLQEVAQALHRWWQRRQRSE
jgi:ribose 1,5-bisphosphokinase